MVIPKIDLKEKTSGTPLILQTHLPLNIFNFDLCHVCSSCTLISFYYDMHSPKSQIILYHVRGHPQLSTFFLMNKTVMNFLLPCPPFNKQNHHVCALKALPPQLSQPPPVNYDHSLILPSGHLSNTLGAVNFQ